MVEEISHPYQAGLNGVVEAVDENGVNSGYLFP
jgi:hypothetical protein